METDETTPLEELTVLLRRERTRWRAWFAGLLVVVVSLGVLGVQAVRASEERARLACETREDYRHVIREIVDYVSRPRGSMDLTGFPGFDQLDPATQGYFENITAALAANSGDGNQELRDFVTPLLPNERC